MQGIAKKKLLVFIAVAYGVSAFMSIFMVIGLQAGKDLTVFVNAQMTYPACGVMLGMLLYEGKEKKLPKAGFIVFMATAAIMMVISILSVFLPETQVVVADAPVSNWDAYSQFVLMAGSVVAYILFWACGREKRENAGLNRKNVRLSILLALLFVFLYVLRIYVSAFLTQLFVAPGMDLVADLNGMLLAPPVWIGAATLLIAFPLSFIAFLGEEYGWRYYFQPVLQKRFGLRAGVVILGILWGVWHLNIDFMFYTTTTGPQMFIGQLITCVSLAIFFGFVYMRTQNIWVIALMHFLNNNLAVLFSGGDAGVLQNQVIAWQQIPIMLVQSLVFAVFILAPIYARGARGADQDKGLPAEDEMEAAVGEV